MQGLNSWILPDPPPLPGPGLFDRLFLEEPWWLAAVCGVAAAVVFVYLNRRAQAKAATTSALILACIGVCVVLLAATIETDREAIVRRSTELVRITAAGEGSFTDLLAEDATLSLWRFSEPLNRDDMIRHVQTDFGPRGEFRLKEYGIKETQAALDGPEVGRSQVKVRVVPEGSGVPVLSWWKINWRKSGGEWRVVRIEPIAISGVADPRGK